MKGARLVRIWRSALRAAYFSLAVLLFGGSGNAQGNTFYFNSGPIPPCDTSIFTANVSGIGTLYPPWMQWAFSLGGIGINITTDHPQTLQIILTSPSGTDLVLSAFNGAGGQNYTNTVFGYGAWTSITTGAAPFTGWWQPQGGQLDIFDYEVADGTWTITVIDTACANGGTGPNGTWTPGWFDGTSSSGGGFDIYFNPGPPPCLAWAPDGSADICAGGTADILAYYQAYNSGYTYTVLDWNWMVVPNPSAVGTPGTYTVEVFDPWAFCSYYAFFNVTQIGAAVLGPDETIDLCGTATVDLSVLFNTAGLTTDWSLNGSSISNATASAASAPGVYQVIGTSTGNCVDTALATVNVLAAPALGPDQTVALCPGTTTDLTTYFMTAGLTTAWTYAGAPVADATAVSTPGQYMLVAINSSGCADTAYVAIAALAGPSLGPDQALTICGAGADLTSVFATNGNGTAWTFGGAPIGAPINATSAGDYTLVVTDPDGCVDMAVVTLTVGAVPVLGPDQSQSICNGATFDLTSAYTTTGLSTSWSFAGIAVPDPTAVATTGAYQLIATNTDGCADTAVVALLANANPVVGPDQNVGFCAGNTADLTAYFTTTGLSTAWTLNGTSVSDPTAVGAIGQYMLVATNAIGCSDTAVATVGVFTGPSLGGDQSLNICSGASADLTSMFNTAGNSSTWLSGGAMIAAPVNATAAGAYTLIVTDQNGCMDTADVTLVVDPSPALGADQSEGICSGATFDLTAAYATTGLATEWTLAGVAVNDPTAIGAAGSYQLIGTNGYGCADTAVVVVLVNANPSPGADQSFELCPWQSVDLTALYSLIGLTATYSLNGNAVGDPTAVADSGTYVVSVVDANGCMGAATVLIDTVHCLCEAQIIPDVNCLQDPAHFTAVADSAILDVQWDFGGGAGNVNVMEPEVFYAAEGDMIVTLTATLTCGVVTVLDTIHVEDCSDSCGTYIPNAFSPNGDGVNDGWTMQSQCMTEEYLVYIFDRWGELIHTGTDPHSPWDGTYNGTLVQDGVYLYRLVYRMPYQEGRKAIGSVTLLR